MLNSIECVCGFLHLPSYQANAIPCSSHIQASSRGLSAALSMVLICILYSCIFTITLAETQYRRTPPFGVAQDTNAASRNLGDYTHSHETVDKSTYTCYSIGECQVCSPLEKVNMSHSM